MYFQLAHTVGGGRPIILKWARNVGLNDVLYARGPSPNIYTNLSGGIAIYNSELSFEAQFSSLNYHPFE
jgi:hypothetical protein